MSTIAQIFNDEVERYDAWYDTPGGRILFENELAAIRTLWREEFRPALEVGVGTGRFAAALGLEHGVDPASRALEIAAARGVTVANASGECLPYASGTFGVVVYLSTLCFAPSPRALFIEAARVLRPGGHILLGDFPADSAWGRFYAAKRDAGHPIFRYARFYSIGELVRVLGETGFTVTAASSTLVTPPESDPVPEIPRAGIDEACGFVCLLATRTT